MQTSEVSKEDWSGGELSCSLEPVIEKAIQGRCDHVLRTIDNPIVGHVDNFVEARALHLASAIHQHRHAPLIAGGDNRAVPVLARVPILAAPHPLSGAVAFRENFPRIVCIQPHDRAVRYVDYVDIVRPEPIVDEIGNEHVLKPECDAIRGTRPHIEIHCFEHL